NIAVSLITFEQAAPYMAEAAGYDQLHEVIWIGSDGTAASEAILQHPTASEFAAEVKFASPMNRPAEETEQSNKDRVREHVQEVLGRETDSYSYNTYDIIWGLSLAIDEAGYDPEAAKEVLPSVTDEWSSVYGASGHIVLNESGDRAFADYDYWILNEDMEWEKVGYYEGATETINWEREIY
ncbi:MAG: ABC transporter substrate-binding protein, partial [Bacillota bacterium]